MTKVIFDNHSPVLVPPAAGSIDEELSFYEGTGTGPDMAKLMKHLITYKYGTCN